MSSNAISAYGTSLQRGNGLSPESFTTIAEIEQITFGFKTDMVDVSNMNSPGSFKEFQAAMIDGGQFQCSIAYVPTDATQNAETGCLYDQVNRIKRNIKLLFSDAETSWLAPCICSDFQITAKHDDVYRATVTYKVVGQPTLS